MNLLLIDSRIKDQQTVIGSLTDNTKYIIFDFFYDTLQTIQDKIIALNTQIINVGLFQENNNLPDYQFISSFENSILFDVQTNDIDLVSWSNFIDLLDFFKNNGMQNFDIMDCNIAIDKNWLYVIRQFEARLNINIHASIDLTGDSAMNGNWILEDGNINLIGLYFCDSIKDYKYILGNNVNHTMMAMCMVVEVLLLVN